MKLFFELEIAYILIGVFFLIVTTIATTRKFSPPNSFKRIFPLVFIFLTIAIFAHFKVTTSRMFEVEKAFLNGETVLCENRTKKEFSKSIMINDNLGWDLKDNVFSNPEYFKGFHSARCVKMLENMKKQ
ncbi:hypothetical protein CRU87_09350 [Aliarcobacter trophiarum LMG 25534]|uniref:Membrane protein n=1 Tax=Aliarcobacter trophiarum LMG 25534 TaxID=1032241 RepID=A0AAD0QJD2_9BACT|nr:hypothetical protein [Aliarcobacter trophiarum]AXK48501.1 putative membrane protein [Aliarcobacter trophiarum LMG 25534]RXI27595.1 hypothetical protein CRU89_04780 [Aliarcobacter trophiarum]RXJ89346.1 hypothetical protein CRU87_09350 [Aliarcobacter trophiarum LMG 25534]